MSNVAISARNISKRFQIGGRRHSSLKERVLHRNSPANKVEDFWALRDVSFELPFGETMGIIGHNGSGKSTALKVLAGIFRPTEGTVAVNGKVSALLELGAGFHPNLTGRENVQLNGSILGMSRKQIDGLLDEIVDFAGIEEFVDWPVKTYSSGMRMRLGFSVAVKLHPQILIIDEIITVGDEEFRRKCSDYLFGLRRSGTSILLVSHALGSVGEMCDSVLWLDRGRVRDSGPAHEVIRAYLDEVNAHEIEMDAAKSPDASRSSAGLVPRRGSGEVQVDDLQLLDAEGEEVPALRSREPATISMRVTAREAIDRINFALVIADENGIVVASPGTTYSGSFDIPKGASTVVFRMPELPLQPGSFVITTMVGQSGQYLDIRDRAFLLRVRSTGLDEAGLALVKGDWQMDPLPLAEPDIPPNAEPSTLAQLPDSHVPSTLANQTD